VQTLEPPDSHHVNAAIGWLGLGCADDAQKELEEVSPPNRNHPEVLEVSWSIFAHKKSWNDALTIARAEVMAQPDDSSGWLHRAYALRRVTDGGLPHAWEALLPAAEKFPEEPVIAYNLSCYACQLQQLDQARIWLKRAMTAGQKESIKKMALADDDLKPLWAEIKAL
jgi:predicted Zn-dependent protease